MKADTAVDDQKLYLVGLGLLFAAPLSILAAIYLTDMEAGDTDKNLRIFTTNLAGITVHFISVLSGLCSSAADRMELVVLNGSATVAVIYCRRRSARPRSADDSAAGI